MEWTPRRRMAHVIALLPLVMTLALYGQTPVGTGFTYHGQIKQGGSPVNGTCDLQFSLFDAASGGNQIGSTATLGNVAVSDGLFTAELDFGVAFHSEKRWLHIEVRCPAATGSNTALSPRQELRATPYALALPGLHTENNATSPNLIGGYRGNNVTSGVVGATISGGGGDLFGVVNFNSVTDDYGTVGGGLGNRAGDGAGSVTDRRYATVGGGYNNSASGLGATVGGGYANDVSGAYATVGGGDYHNVSGLSATVGGGHDNNVSGAYATVGGGYNNNASGLRATVGGGIDNDVSGSAATVGGGDYNRASGAYATVGGGAFNRAGGSYATVAGGRNNVAAGDYSFAAGHRAKANNRGCFVLADSTDADEPCVDDNRFVFRVTNAFYIWTTVPHTAGVLLPTGGNAWSSISSRASKENFFPVDPRETLARLASIPIRTWNYKSQDRSIRHMGPMAEDFHTAFGLGEEDQRISTVDADGVALAAIQGLYLELKERDAKITALVQQLHDLREAVSRIAGNKEHRR